MKKVLKYMVCLLVVCGFILSANSQNVSAKQIQQGGGGGGSMVSAALPKGYFTSIKNAPAYPKNFSGVSKTKHNVNNTTRLNELRKVRSGTWKKVYYDGKVSSSKKSVHYFEHSSGLVYDVKVKSGWSNVCKP